MSQERENLALPAGTMVGPYRLNQVQTAWGFYLTYFAEVSATGRQVLVHELLPEELVERGTGGAVRAKAERAEESLAWARDRFAIEGRGLAACAHPAIHPILDVLEANGTAYWITPPEPGQSLKRWLEGLGRAPTEGELRTLLGPLLSALQQLHAASLPHLNLKPETIRVTPDGVPVLVHFAGSRQAIARHSHEAGAATTGFSPIEQYDADKTEGPWTDIYSLAAVLHRAVSGRIPPEATRRLQSDPYQRLAGVVSGQYSGGFLRAIDAALAPAAAARPQNIEGWRKMLGIPADHGVASIVRRNPRRTALVAALAAALLGVGLWAVFRPKPIPPLDDPARKAAFEKDREKKEAEEQKQTGQEKKKLEEQKKAEEAKIAEEQRKAEEEKLVEARKNAEEDRIAAEKEAQGRAVAKEQAEAAAAQKAGDGKALDEKAQGEKAAAEKAAEEVGEAKGAAKKKAAEKAAAEAAERAREAQSLADKAAAEKAAAEVAAKQAGVEAVTAGKTAAEKTVLEKTIEEQLATAAAARKAAEAKAAADQAAADQALAEKAAAEKAALRAAQEKAAAQQLAAEKAAAEMVAAEELAAAIGAQKALAAKMDPQKTAAEKAGAEKAAAEKVATEKAAAEMAARKATEEKAAAGKEAAEKAEAELAAKKAAAEKAAADKAAAEKALAEKEKENSSQGKGGPPPPPPSGGGGQVGSNLGGIWETVEKDESGRARQRLIIYADTHYELRSGSGTDTGIMMAKLGIIQMESDKTHNDANSTFKYKSMSLIETDGALGKQEWVRVSPEAPPRAKDQKN